MLEFPAYDPAAWHWQIAGDSRVWSSAVGEWLSDVPASGLVTELNNIAELDEVLRRNGLPSPLISSADVDVERDRRIAGGFVYNSVLYQSRPQDLENVAGASTAALGAIVSGALPGNLRWHGGETDFSWLAANNSATSLDAHQVFAFAQAAMAHKQAHIFAARYIKDMSPIPADYATNETYW